MQKNIDKQIERESVFGIVPVLRNEKKYSFLDAFLILSGFAVATWCYTQGAYLVSFINFKQLIISAFAGNLIILCIYLAPIVMATRYGIDMWIWFKAVFGQKGVKVLTVIIILVNFPWYAVCADIFAGSMINLCAAFGVIVPEWTHTGFALLCVLLGTLMALKGPIVIQWTTRILVPALLVVGIIIVFISFSAVSFGEIWNYKPDTSSWPNKVEPYMISVEGNFAFAFSWCCSAFVLARLCKKESGAYWATSLSYGIVAPFFVFAGGVMGIVTSIIFGETISDPTVMLSLLGGPVLALLSLLLVAFANIGTQGVGSYLFTIMLKSAFPKVDYRILVICLGVYVSLLAIWGQIIEYFGAMISLSSYIYGPVMALLFVDYFVVRKRKLAFRSAFDIEGYDKYNYTKGFNLIGFLCVIVGTGAALIVYDPINGVVHSSIFYLLTATGTGFIVTCIFYYILYKIPFINKYILQDRNEITM